MLVDQVQASPSRDEEEVGQRVVGRGSRVGEDRDGHTPVYVLPDEQAADRVEGQVRRKRWVLEIRVAAGCELPQGRYWAFTSGPLEEQPVLQLPGHGSSSLLYPFPLQRRHSKLTGTSLPHGDNC